MILSHPRSMRSYFCAGIVAFALSACSDSEPAASDPAQSDALTESALRDDIAVDPDLASQNPANSAATVSSASGALAASAMTPEATARARAEMVKLVGGTGNLRKAPAAQPVSGSLPPEAALTAAARAAASPGGSGNCAEKAQYSMAWAARLPEPFPVLPHGATQEAAGSDEGACKLRVVNYITALPTDAVMDFYFTRASDAGYSAQRVLEGGDDVLGGTKGGASYIVYARKHPKGGTEVDLVTSGG